MSATAPFELEITARVAGKDMVAATVSVATAQELDSLCNATAAAIERWSRAREAPPLCALCDGARVVRRGFVTQPCRCIAAGAMS